MDAEAIQQVITDIVHLMKQLSTSNVPSAWKSDGTHQAFTHLANILGQSKFSKLPAIIKDNEKIKQLITQTTYM
eukprot:15328501-Ditylum_brightwellii.AAC.1